MPTIDVPAIGGIIADLALSILTYAGIAAILYSIGGILIRTVSWTFDVLLVNFIGKFYGYFEMIIKGTLLTDSTVSAMMDRVYLLVGVFVVFRLSVLLINYIINPSEVMDEKVGVSALVKRVIIGLIMIIFMPSIFGLAFRLQDAILEDQVIERIIMSEEEMKKADEYKKKHGMGKIIGMTIFQGFFSISENAKSNGSVKKNYEKATDINKTYDLSVINSLGGGLNSGILYKHGDEYAHDYFPIFSCAVLIFVLYMLVQYCLDAVVRSLKLSVLQVVAPICIVEYMINSDRNEVFKSWRKAVVSTFTMLLMRVASIWFVVYVTLLMQPGMTDSSSLLQTKDNLLRAIIVLGLLAFMMDFPKMMSDVFGLNLEQSGSVKGVLGKAMGVATAGLALGGAAAGLGFKAAGGLKNTAKGGLTRLAGKDSSFAKGLNNPFKTAASQGVAFGAGMTAGLSAMSDTAKNGGKLKDNYKNARAQLDKDAKKVKDSKVGQTAATVGAAFAESAKDEKLGTTLKTGAMAMGAAVLASNALTKSVAGGYDSVDSKVSGAKQKESEQAHRQKTLSVMKNIDVTTQASYGQQVAANGKLDSIVDNTEVTATQTVNMEQKLGKIGGSVDAIAQNTETTATQTVNMDQKLGKITGSVDAIAQNTETTATQTVNMDQKLGKISGDVASISRDTDVVASDIVLRENITVERTTAVDDSKISTNRSSLIDTKSDDKSTLDV